MKIDLHIHSSASDGKFSPKEVIDFAVELGVKAIAITDHDGVDGLKEAIDYSRDKKIEFVPGVEFSADPKDLAKEIHIVALFIDYKNKEILDLIVKQRECRLRLIHKVIKKLNELGYEISYEEALKESGGESFGRPTLAQLLMKKYPQFKDRKQVFNELLGKEGKAFFKSEAASIPEIISVIHSAGGLAILAHPAYLFENSEKVIQEFAKFGGDGLEVDCPYENFGEKAQELRDKFRKLAEDNNLAVSGGTDFHDKNDGVNIGSFGISEKEFKKLKSFSKKYC